MEILFKGKGKHGVKWAVGQLLTDPFGDMYIMQWVDCGNNYNTIYVDVQKDSICRYTGLTYQDGTKVWEMDIISYNHNYDAIGIIRYGEFNKKYIGFYIEWIGIHHDMRNDPLYWIDKVKCIGNVVDNPELLEVDDD